MSTLNWYWFRWKPLLLFILAIVHPVISNGNNKSTDISFKKPSIAQSCSKITQFAQSASAFTYCSLTTSESNLCRKCQDEMTGIYDNYLAINTMLPEPGESTACPEEIISTKKLSDIRDYFKHTESVWLKGNCDTCYEVETPNEESSRLGRKHNLQVFDDLVTTFVACVDLNPNNTCDRCGDAYADLNKFYDDLTTKFNGNLCFEISMTMADQRSRWSNDLHCFVVNENDYVVIVIGGIVILVSILLYFISRNFMRVMKPSLMIPKRHSMVNVRHFEEVSETTPIIQ